MSLMYSMTCELLSLLINCNNLVLKEHVRLVLLKIISNSIIFMRKVFMVFRAFSRMFFSEMEQISLKYALKIEKSSVSRISESLVPSLSSFSNESMLAVIVCMNLIRLPIRIDQLWIIFNQFGNDVQIVLFNLIFLEQF